MTTADLIDAQVRAEHKQDEPWGSTLARVASSFDGAWAGLVAAGLDPFEYHAGSEVYAAAWRWLYANHGGDRLLPV
jgi:hypothetical protein